MPARNQSEGFQDRNQHLGTYWTSLDSDHKDLYHEDIFYALGYLACGWELPPAMSLTEDERSKYLPIFKESVNLDKLAYDLGKGKFGPHLVTSNQNKGVKEIERIDNEASPESSLFLLTNTYQWLTPWVQLQIVNIRYGVQYALMACSWNPGTRNQKAHWEIERSSCDNWTHISETKWHLLETFVRETIKAEVCPKAQKIPQPSDEVKMRLTSALNGLVSESPFNIFIDHF